METEAGADAPMVAARLLLYASGSLWAALQWIRSVAFLSQLRDGLKHPRMVFVGEFGRLQ
jgi:hypothetical protein